MDRQHGWLWSAALLTGGALAVRTAVRQSRKMDLRGKTALITGGSRGLGLVIARQLADEGMNLAVCARDENEINRARAELQTIAPDVLAVQCDVTAQQQVQGMVDGVTKHFGRIDVLINNAGTIAVGPMEEMTLADYEDAMNTHFWGPFHMTMAVLPQMKQRKSGRIVNISSIGGKIAPPHLLPYAASKFALVGFSEGLRAELKQHGIYVTTVCPGLMRTGSPRNAFFKGKHREEYAWFSISDSIPGASISAERAAAKILHGLKYGVAEVTYPFTSTAAIKFNGLFPGFNSELMSLMNAMLPGPGGIGTTRARGYQSYSEASPSRLTALTEEAAIRNNEILETEDRRGG